jgi:hypothetical protein
MVYSKTILAPAGGSEGALEQEDMAITLGLIYQVEIYFPPGSSGLLHCRIMDGGYQAWPSEPGESFFGDNTLITFPDLYFNRSPKKVLSIRYWNEDDTFEHRFLVRIGQASDEVFIASYLPTLTIDSIRKLLQDQAEQAEQVSMETVESIAAGLRA